MNHNVVLLCTLLIVLAVGALLGMLDIGGK